MIWRPPQCKSCGERSWGDAELTDEERSELTQNHPDSRGWKKAICANCGYERVWSTLELL